MQVSVTSQHIEHGVVADCQHCPIAVALAALGFDVTVDPTRVVFYSRADDEGEFIGDVLGEVKLPWAARRFLRRFDLGKPVQPFVFELAIPYDLARLFLLIVVNLYTEKTK
jgi:hypothetical protein